MQNTNKVLFQHFLGFYHCVVVPDQAPLKNNEAYRADYLYRYGLIMRGITGGN